ncbi:MAG: acylphosphatase [Candidatus Aenigmarchaeota archaeon]|nr:acylphosphatase [Candidatus Aenigmarchaeota archaeon]
MQQVKIKIYGRVQGVGFRYFVYINTKKQNVTGYVKNLPDGTVEALFEGDEKQIHEMIRICKKGPPMAKVDRIEIIGRKHIDSNEYEDFSIIR